MSQHGPGALPSVDRVGVTLATRVQAVATTTIAVLAVRAGLPVASYVIGFVVGPSDFWRVYRGLRELCGLVGIALYLVWFARFYTWVREVRGGTAFSTAFAVGGWFIPFLNFFIPYVALKDAVVRMNSPRTTAVGIRLDGSAPEVALWWSAFMVTVVLNIVLAVPPLFLALGPVASVVSMVLMVSQVMAYGLLAWIVRSLTLRCSADA
jgi:hypothetical protein